MKYHRGFKYQLVEEERALTGIRGFPITLGGFLKMDAEGELTISAGYAWDGPSGPTFDTPTFMRASLVHDALYQIMRAGLLSGSYREYADKLMKEICIDDGMSSFRAWYTYNAVRAFADSAADPSSRKQTITAP